MNTNPRALLALADAQMAAETVFTMGFRSGPIDARDLLRGNDRASTFTTSQANKFVSEWAVVDHKSNTNSGFSGTLFRYTGETDPSRGLIKDQLVMSFRSTEFIDDAVRDNQATNVMEIKKFGWAFGQIADMRRWFESLNLGATPLTLTGYSLGGHLATAFAVPQQQQGHAGLIAITRPRPRPCSVAVGTARRSTIDLAANSEQFSAAA